VWVANSLDGTVSGSTSAAGGPSEPRVQVLRKTVLIRHAV
jgi:hypothetical protein